MRLDNKVAFISGGARGLGAAQAKLFALEGAKVAIGDLLEEEGRRTVQDIVETGGDAIFVRLDVTDQGNWETAVRATVEKYVT